MSVRGSTGPQTGSVAVVRFLRCLVVGILGLAALGWVLEMAGNEGKVAVHESEPDVVVVHVTEPDVQVVVGCWTYRIEGWASEPIVCRLPDGHHDLIMTRDGELLYKEAFTVRTGENVVLTAWDPHRTRERAAREPRP
jgi:hypothetical protein